MKSPFLWEWDGSSQREAKDSQVEGDQYPRRLLHVHVGRVCFPVNHTGIPILSREETVSYPRTYYFGIMVFGLAKQVCHPPASHTQISTRLPRSFLWLNKRQNADFSILRKLLMLNWKLNKWNLYTALVLFSICFHLNFCVLDKLSSLCFESHYIIIICTCQVAVAISKTHVLFISFEPHLWWYMLLILHFTNNKAENQSCYWEARVKLKRKTTKSKHQHHLTTCPVIFLSTALDFLHDSCPQSQHQETELP